MKAFTDVLHLDNYNLNDGVFYLNQYKEKQLKIQILKEYPGKNHYDAHNMFNGKRAFNNRYKEWDSDKHCFNFNLNPEIRVKQFNLQFK